MSKISTMLWKDARGIYRDGFLLYLCAYAPLIAIAARLGVPWISIESLALYVAPWLVTLGASLAAIVFGFGLIEERERQTLLLLLGELHLLERDALAVRDALHFLEVFRGDVGLEPLERAAQDCLYRRPQPRAGGSRPAQSARSARGGARASRAAARLTTHRTLECALVRGCGAPVGL